MLSAAVAGDVFISPSVDAIVAAIRAVSGPAGALLIRKNYRGDRLNFDLATELANADGIPTPVVVVADDVALHDTVEPSRRRGCLVHEVPGAAASASLTLDAFAAEAAAAAEEVGTMGVALGPPRSPLLAGPASRSPIRKSSSDSAYTANWACAVCQSSRRMVVESIITYHNYCHHHEIKQQARSAPGQWARRHALPWRLRL
jgi:hypothetical protein